MTEDAEGNVQALMTDDSPQRISELVEQLADEATLWTTVEICRRSEDGSIALPGVAGRLQTHKDVHFEVLFLVGALATGEPAFFADYVRWLAGALHNRGAPTASIAQAVQLMREFFVQRLDKPSFAAVERVLDAGISALAGSGRGLEGLTDAHLPQALPEAKLLTDRLIQGDIGGSRSLMLQAYAGSNNYLRIATGLFQPALYTIGDLWETNQITVGQEHLATVISQTLLAQLYLTANFPEPHDRRAMFGCVEGNHHALGLRMAADAFELSGWKVQFLGGNVPLDSLIAQVDRWRPEVVGLSAAMVQHLPALRRATDALHGEFAGGRPTIMVGGLATNRNDQAWRWIGADVWCPDAEHVLNLGM